MNVIFIHPKKRLYNDSDFENKINMKKRAKYSKHQRKDLRHTGPKPITQSLIVRSFSQKGAESVFYIFVNDTSELGKIGRAHV